MLTAKQAIRLSAVVDKLDISIPDAEATQERVGADLILQMVKKAHKAEQEIYEFIALIKKCTLEEAEEVDFIKLLKGLFADPEIASFFKSAVK